MKSYRIDCFPESALRCGPDYAIVAIDVIRATTMAVTAVSLGWQCYAAGSLEDAALLARRLNNPLLAGEIGGEKPAGFHMNNSPAELAGMQETSRPLILLSSSGTKLIANALGNDPVYLACFRNAACTADRLIRDGCSRVALLGAGSRGEFREEDQMGCAWIAASLERAGYVPEDQASADVTKRWGTAQAAECLVSHSVSYLRRSNQIADLWFILDRINDLEACFTADPLGLIMQAPAEMVVVHDLTMHRLAQRSGSSD